MLFYGFRWYSREDPSRHKSTNYALIIDKVEVRVEYSI